MLYVLVLSMGSIMADWPRRFFTFSLKCIQKNECFVFKFPTAVVPLACHGHP